MEGWAWLVALGEFVTVPAMDKEFSLRIPLLLLNIALQSDRFLVKAYGNLAFANWAASSGIAFASPNSVAFLSGRYPASALTLYPQ